MAMVKKAAQAVVSRICAEDLLHSSLDRDKVERSMHAHLESLHQKDRPLTWLPDAFAWWVSTRLRGIDVRWEETRQWMASLQQAARVPTRPWGSLPHPDWQVVAEVPELVARSRIWRAARTAVEIPAHSLGCPVSERC